MTEENYRENNPDKYRLSDGTIITESNYNTLLQSFTSTYNSMTNENNGYVTDVEKRNLNALLHSFKEIGSMNLAMEFDKESRFLAYTHWNSQENKFDVNHRNAPEKWFEKSTQQLTQEQEMEDIQTTISLSNISEDIVILPYSRKPEDIQAMKFFIANVSGNNIENISNQNAQAFIDNIGNEEECSLTLKQDGIFEYIDTSSFEGTTDNDEILSIIYDNANDHITGVAPDSEQMKDFKYINSIMEQNDVQTQNLENELSEKDKELDIRTAKAETDNKEISRLKARLEAANNTIQKLEKQNKEQDELLNGKGSVKVNGVERTFDKGLKHAFPEAIKRIDIENQRNKDLTAAYNELLKSQNQNISPKSPGDDSSLSI